MQKSVKKIKLQDIADAAEVSVALVSYVLNNRHTNRIKKETAERIRTIAKELNYRPNHFAKGLKTQKSNTLGLILADIGVPFSAQIASIVEREAQKEGFVVLMGSTEEKDEKLSQLIDTFLKRQVDGLLIMPTENAEQEIELLHKSGVPYILLDRYFPDQDFNFVVCDNHFGTYAATKQLLESGKRKIGFITIETKLFHFLDRKNGFIDAFKEKGFSTEYLIKEVKLYPLQENTFKALDELVQENEELDAILFTTDILTMYGMKYAVKNKLSVPNDIEIVGFDEADFYEIFPMPITYYKQPIERIVEKSMDFLLNKIKNKDSKQIQEVIKGELIS